MTQLKSYPDYKNSGVEWLGTIPRPWEIASLTRVLESIVDYRGKTPEKKRDGIFLITAKNIKNGIIDYDLSQEFIEPSKYDEVMRRGKPQLGDVLFTTEAPLGEVANVDRENIALAQRIIKFRGKEGILNNYYLKYWIRSQKFQDNLKTFATGSTAQGIKASKLGMLIVLLPSYKEQLLISDFLNKKTSEIDALISEKQRLIELLEEKRQAVITETVTKGLNPNVKMKDSGIEWIGEIPEHWETTKVKHLSDENLIYGANEPAELTDRTLPRYIRITDIDIDGFLKEDTYRSLSYELASKYPVDKGDLLFARSGASVGKTYLHQMDKRATYAGYLIKYRSNPKKLNSKYLYYFTYSNAYKEWIQANTIQATIENVSAEKYGNMQIPYPKLEEQSTIVRFIDNYISNSREIIAGIKQQIAKLKEYRESLIYEAVTGKIDVRDYALDKEEVY